MAEGTSNSNEGDELLSLSTNSTGSAGTPDTPQHGVSPHSPGSNGSQSEQGDQSPSTRSHVVNSNSIVGGEARDGKVGKKGGGWCCR